jgi:ferredoxin
VNIKQQQAQNQLTKETFWMQHLLWAFLTTVASGLVTYFIKGGHHFWKQWVYLAHTFVGIYLAIIMVPYIFRHFKRTLPLRRVGILVSGIIALIVMLVLAVTGFWMIYRGQREALRWVYDYHVVAGFITLGLLFIHLLGHRLFLSEQRRKTETIWFASISFSLLKSSLIKLAIASVFVVLAAMVYQKIPSTYRDEAKVVPYELPYGQHPFRPGQTETINSQFFLDERRLVKSQQCATCHRQIVEEWQESMHAQAASDKAYERNVNLLAEKRGIAATRYCEGCHAPVALMTGQLSKGGVHGGIVGSPANREGVNCMGCHGIDEAVHLRGVGSYRMNPVDNYLFADRQEMWATMIHNFLVRIHPQEHRREMDRPIVSNPQLCATCHVQFMDKDMNQWGWIKMQDEYTAWLKSPYSHQSERTFAHEQMRRCQDCHMPLTKSDDPSANKEGMTRSHRTPGANTAIPWLMGDEKQLESVKSFLQSGKVRIDIEEPYRKQGPRSQQFVSAEALIETDAPYYFYMGEDVTLNVIVLNTLVGHDFPGGTIDINEAWIAFKVVDAQNKVIYESGYLLDDLSVDPKAQIYRSVPVDRKGNHVWRHDLFNMVGQSYRKTIPPGQSDIVPYTFKIPYWVKGPLTVSAVVRYRKFNQKYAEWALEHKGIELPIVDVARDALIIPIRYKPEIEKLEPPLD